MSQTTSHRGTGEAAVSLELPKPVAFRVRTGIKSYGYWTSDGSDFGYEKLFTESQLLTYVAKCVDEDLKEHDQRTADQCPHSTPYRYPCDQCNDEAQESGNGVTIRPSAAEVELRAEVERLRQSLHDIQKPGALKHFASRWDQINRILEAAGIEPDPDNWVNDVQTLVTERDQLRAELERVRSCMKTTFWVSAYDDSGYGDDRSKEFSDEGEALSYAKSLGDRFMPSVSKRMSFALNASELIYSRAAPSQLKQPPIEPIPGTTAALAKLTIRGGGHG